MELDATGMACCMVTSIRLKKSCINCSVLMSGAVGDTEDVAAVEVVSAEVSESKNVAAA